MEPIPWFPFSAFLFQLLCLNSQASRPASLSHTNTSATSSIPTLWQAASQVTPPQGSHLLGFTFRGAPSKALGWTDPKEYDTSHGMSLLRLGYKRTLESILLTPSHKNGSQLPLEPQEETSCRVSHKKKPDPTWATLCRGHIARNCGQVSLRLAARKELKPSAQQLTRT